MAAHALSKESLASLLDFAAKVLKVPEPDRILNDAVSSPPLYSEMSRLTLEILSDAARTAGVKVKSLVMQDFSSLCLLWSPRTLKCESCGMPGIEIKDGRMLLLATGALCSYCNKGLLSVAIDKKEQILDWMTGQMIDKDPEGTFNRTIMPGQRISIEPPVIHPFLYKVCEAEKVDITVVMRHLYLVPAYGCVNQPLAVLEWVRTLPGDWEEPGLRGLVRSAFSLFQAKTSSEAASISDNVGKAILIDVSNHPTGPALQKLCEALLSAFPNRSALSMMLQYRMDTRLNHIVGEGLNMAHTVLKVIEWASSRGDLRALILVAKEENPGNQLLRLITV